jgi:hypothetical protein
LATLCIIAIVFGSLGILTGVLVAMDALMAEAAPVIDPIMKAVRGDAALQGCKWFCIFGGGLAAAITLLGGVDCLRRRPSGRLWLRVSAWAYIALWAIAMAIWLGHGFTIIDDARVGSANYYSQSYAAGFSAPRFDDTLALLAGPLLLATILTWAWSASVLLALRRPRWDGARWAAVAAMAATEGEERGVDVVYEPDRKELSSAAPDDQAAGPHQPGAMLPYRSRQRPAEARQAEPLVAGPRIAAAIYFACIGFGLLYAVSAMWSVSRLWEERRLLNRAFARAGVVGSSSGLTDLPMPLLAESAITMAALSVLTGAILALRGVRGGRLVILSAVGVWMLADTTTFCLTTLPTHFRFQGAANAGTLGGIIVRGRTGTLPLLAALGMFLRTQALAVVCFVALRRRDL